MIFNNIPKEYITLLTMNQKLQQLYAENSKNTKVRHVDNSTCNAAVKQTSKLKAINQISSGNRVFLVTDSDNKKTMYAQCTKKFKDLDENNNLCSTHMKESKNPTIIFDDLIENKDDVYKNVEELTIEHEFLTKSSRAGSSLSFKFNSDEDPILNVLKHANPLYRKYITSMSKTILQMAITNASDESEILSNVVEVYETIEDEEYLVYLNKPKSTTSKPRARRTTKASTDNARTSSTSTKTNNKVSNKSDEKVSVTKTKKSSSKTTKSIVNLSETENENSEVSTVKHQTDSEDCGYETSRNNKSDDEESNNSMPNFTSIYHGNDEFFIDDDNLADGIVYTCDENSYNELGKLMSTSKKYEQINHNGKSYTIILEHKYNNSLYEYCYFSKLIFETHEHKCVKEIGKFNDTMTPILSKK